MMTTQTAGQGPAMRARGDWCDAGACGMCREDDCMCECHDSASEDGWTRDNDWGPLS